MDKYQTLREKNDPSNNVYPNIQTQNIPDGAVITAKLADSSVSSAKIATNAVTTSKLATQSVTANSISDGAVTSAKLATSAVTTNKISPLAVDASCLATNSVTTAKIRDGAVTTQKLATGINSVNHPVSETSFTTIAEFVAWIEEQILNGRQAIYYDGMGYSTIGCVSTGGQEVYIYCQFPPNAGLNQTETISSDADVVAMYNGLVGQCLCFIGV